MIFSTCRMFVLIFLLLFAVQSVWAATSVTAPYLFTQNHSPNRLGMFFPEGPHLALGCEVLDTLGVPENISSVKAVAQDPSQPDYDLEFGYVVFLGGFYQVPFTDAPYQGQTGRWTIEVVNKQGEKATIDTHVLDKIYMIPFAENIRFSDNSLTPTITWDPVTYDHDFDPLTKEISVDHYRLRLIKPDGTQFFRSGQLQETKFEVPFGPLEYEKPVYVRIESRQIDHEEGVLENRSETFTDFLFVPFGSYTQDACSKSDLQPTVKIGEIETGAENILFDNGCSISDYINQCRQNFTTHGEFVSCVADLTNTLLAEKVIEDWEKGAIQSGAARSKDI